MDYSPPVKHVEFPSTEVFVQIAEIQIWYRVRVCLFFKKEYRNGDFLLTMSSMIHIFTMVKQYSSKLLVFFVSKIPGAEGDKTCM